MPITLPVLMAKGFLISGNRAYTPRILAPSISGVTPAVHVLEVPL
jgi:hypothetical protein